MTLLLLTSCSAELPVPDSGAPSTPHESGLDSAAPPDSDGDTGPHVDAPLDLCINEFMPTNVSSVQDESLRFPDWIELHNPGPEDIALTGWTLSDFRLEPDKHVFIGGLVVPAGGFRLLWADGRPDTGAAHLSFRLSGDGGEVALFAPDGRGSIVTYDEIFADFSIARVPDCCRREDCFSFDYHGTPGLTNVEPA